MWQKVKNNYHLLRAAGASIRFGFPARSMTVIGVTGTDGKTTTASLIYHILKESGEKASLISTVEAIIDGKSMDTGFHVTTPDAYVLQKYLRLARNAGSKYLVLEVTSHALDQNRTFSIPFTLGVVTNITHEHLDYHKTYEKYLKAKVKLLKIAKGVIINKDDMSYSQIMKHLGKIDEKKVITYGFSEEAQVTPKKFPFTTNITAKFNMYNILASIAACGFLGISQKSIESGIKSFRMPKGRMEIVYDGDFSVLVDFAHTPNAIEQLLSSLKNELKPKRRIIHVFGSAGDRDKAKRPLMGESSAKFSDIIILTAEDPRYEEVSDIVSDIEGGISSKSTLQIFKIPGRLEAIQKAIDIAEKDDLVVITGKGHENSMAIEGIENSWSDQIAVVDAIRHRNIK